MGMAPDKARFDRLRQSVLTARVARLARDTEDYALQLHASGGEDIERLQKLAIEMKSVADGLVSAQSRQR